MVRLQAIILVDVSSGCFERSWRVEEGGRLAGSRDGKEMGSGKTNPCGADPEKAAIP